MPKNLVDFVFLLYFVSLPVALLATVSVLGWCYRRSVARSMRNEAGESTPPSPDLKIATGPPTAIPLVLRRLNASDVRDAKGQIADTVLEAERAARNTRRVFIMAGIIYLALITFALEIGLAAKIRSYPAYAQFILIYLQAFSPLLILVWLFGISLPLRLAILGVYLLFGLLTMPLAPSYQYVVKATVSVLPFVVPPIAGLLLLVARPLRPWLVSIFAILIYFVTAIAVAFLFGLFNQRMGAMNPAWLVAGIMFQVIAVALVWWTLRRGAWHLPLGALALLSALAFLVLWLIPNCKVGPFHLGALLVGLPSNVLQVFFVWLLFKLIMQLQERQLLSAQVLHYHLCWGFLTIYHLIVTASTIEFGLYQWWTPCAVVFAYLACCAFLHVSLRKIWATRVHIPGKRLLFLRVFGKADKRESLLDALDDTWRQLGRIDLLAGTDLATRTMSSLMLEAFLLRRTDDQFLKTGEDVERRLRHLHSQLEGDARFPVNGIYFYATAWRPAVANLAPKSDAVLMDLRDFRRTNEGCVFELRWVVQRIPPSRVIILVDSTSDFRTLEEIVQAAWAQRSSDPLESSHEDPQLVVLNANWRFRDSRRALFTLLVGAMSKVAP